MIEPVGTFVIPDDHRLQPRHIPDRNPGVAEFAVVAADKFHCEAVTHVGIYIPTHTESQPAKSNPVLRRIVEVSCFHQVDAGR